MPSSSEVGNFQDLIAQLAAVAITRTTELMRSTQDVAVVQEAYPVVVDPFIAASGQLTAEWYRSLDPEAEFAVEPAPPPATAALQANVRWALTQLDPIGALTGTAERQVFAISRDTVVTNASRERVRYARYASANACPWCRVQATRGAVFYTPEAATKGHENCHCMYVAERGGNVYTPPSYVEQWKTDYKDARSADGPKVATSSTTCVELSIRTKKTCSMRSAAEGMRRKRRLAKPPKNNDFPMRG